MWHTIKISPQSYQNFRKFSSFFLILNFISVLDQFYLFNSTNCQSQTTFWSRHGLKSQKVEWKQAVLSEIWRGNVQAVYLAPLPETFSCTEQSSHCTYVSKGCIHSGSESNIKMHSWDPGASHQQTVPGGLGLPLSMAELSSNLQLKSYRALRLLARPQTGKATVSFISDLK